MNPENEIDLINIINNIPIFQGFPMDALRMVIQLLNLKEYPTDKQIILEGTKGKSMYIIKKGSVKVSRTEKSGEEIFIANLYSGSYFGELSLIDNLPRSADVTSLEDTVIFQLKKDDLDKLLNDNDAIGSIFYKNCIRETFSRFRNIIANFTFSQHTLKEKSAILDEINKDLSLAKKLQGFFIDTEHLDSENEIFEGVKHSYIYHPCIAIGGDFVNVIRLDENQFSIIIADVEGHGITAALATGVLKSAYSIMIEKYATRPIELMKFLNKHFVEVISRLYATCYYALINMKEKNITFAKAGHHHPLFWKESKNDFIEIDCVGNGLGIITDANFGQAVFDIETGDKVLFYTDGIIEQINEKKEMYSKSRLKRVVKDLIEKKEQNILKTLFKDLEDFAGSNQFEDDITMILFEF